MQRNICFNATAAHYLEQHILKFQNETVVHMDRFSFKCNNFVRYVIDTLRECVELLSSGFILHLRRWSIHAKYGWREDITTGKIKRRPKTREVVGCGCQVGLHGGSATLSTILGAGLIHYPSRFSAKGRMFRMRTFCQRLILQLPPTYFFIYLFIFCENLSLDSL